MKLNLLDLFRHEQNVERFAAGQTIVDEGAPGRTMYVILEGEVDILAGSRHLGSAGPGDIIGEMALIDSNERCASAVAHSDCRLIPVDIKRFNYMVQQTPYFALHVMQVLVDRLRRMDSRS